MLLGNQLRNENEIHYSLSLFSTTQLNICTGVRGDSERARGSDRFVGYFMKVRVWYYGDLVKG